MYFDSLILLQKLPIPILFMHDTIFMLPPYWLFVSSFQGPAGFLDLFYSTPNFKQGRILLSK